MIPRKIAQEPDIEKGTIAADIQNAEESQTLDTSAVFPPKNQPHGDESTFSDLRNDQNGRERAKAERYKNPGTRDPNPNVTNPPTKPYPKRRTFGIVKHRRAGKPTQGRDDFTSANYPDDDYYKEMAPEARVWRTYLDESEMFDFEMVEGWKDNIDVLLVFAGLFSAIVTAFVIQNSQKFDTDQGEATTALLQELVFLQKTALNGSTLFDPTQVPDVKPGPSANSYDFVACLLWYASLCFGLITALGAVLAKQWLQYYTAMTTGTPQKRARVHQRRLRSLHHWKVPVIINFLPILLHIAVFLFFAGLALFLFPLTEPIAIMVACIAFIAFLAYFFAAIISAVEEDCPYKTPLTFFFNYLIYSTLRKFRSLIHHYNPPNKDTLSPGLQGSTQHPQGSQVVHEDLKVHEYQLDCHALEWLLDSASGPAVRDVVLHSLGGLPQQFPRELLGKLWEGNLGRALVQKLSSVGFPAEVSKESGVPSVYGIIAGLQHRWDALENSRSIESLLRGFARLARSTTTFQSQESEQGPPQVIGSALRELLDVHQNADVTPNRLHLWTTTTSLLGPTTIDPIEYQYVLADLFNSEKGGDANIHSMALPPAMWISIFEGLGAAMSGQKLTSDIYVLMLECLSLLPLPPDPDVPVPHLLVGHEPHPLVTADREGPITLVAGAQRDSLIAHAIMDCISKCYGVESTTDRLGDRYCCLSVLVWLECLVGGHFGNFGSHVRKLGLIARRLKEWVLYLDIHDPTWYNNGLKQYIRDQVGGFVQRNVAADTTDWDDEGVEAIVSLCFALFNQPQDEALQEVLSISDSLPPPPYLIRGLGASIRSHYSSGSGRDQLPHRSLHKIVSTWIQTAEQDQRILTDIRQHILTIPGILRSTPESNPSSATSSPNLVYALFGLFDSIADSTEKQQLSLVIFDTPPEAVCDFLLASFHDDSDRMETKTRLRVLQKYAGNNDLWVGFVGKVVNSINQRLHWSLKDGHYPLDTGDVGWLCEILDELMEEVM